MRRDPRSFLWDVRDAADTIASFARGRTLADYQANRMLRSAIERQFEIAGEALSRLRRTEPELARRIPDINRIIGFRNTLAHGYDRIADGEVWQSVQQDLPLLRDCVAALLTELGEDP